jgi:hypothetical protein
LKPRELDEDDCATAAVSFIAGQGAEQVGGMRPSRKRERMQSSRKGRRRPPPPEQELEKSLVIKRSRPCSQKRRVEL